MNESDLSNEPHSAICDNIPKNKLKGQTTIAVIWIISAFSALPEFLFDKEQAMFYSLSTKMVVTFLSLILVTWYLFLGFGWFYAKRWARPLILAYSWACFLYNLNFVVGYDLIFSEKRSADWADKYAVFSLDLIFYLVLIIYCSRKKVRDFFIRKNQKPCWTYLYPLPILIGVIFFVHWADSFAYDAIYSWPLPFFGEFITSYQGMTMNILAAVTCLTTAYGLYKQKTWAIWSGVILILAWAASSCITFYYHTMTEYFELFNTPEQMAGFESYNIPDGFHRSLYFGAGLLIAAGYLIYIRKYFNRKKICVEFSTLPAVVNNLCTSKSAIDD